MRARAFLKAGLAPIVGGVVGLLATAPATASPLPSGARSLWPGGMMGGAVADPERFYGYYTPHNLRDGEIEGMLSVNGFTGEAWYHAWRGPFAHTRKGAASAGGG